MAKILSVVCHCLPRGDDQIKSNMFWVDLNPDL